MNPSLIAGNKLAHDNGAFTEQFVRERLPDIEWIKEPVDCIIGGRYAEIKSCMVATRDGERFRSGRFWFREDQHNFLVENGGLYVLLVQYEGEILYSRIVKASALPLSFDSAIPVTWWKLFNRLSGNTIQRPIPITA